MKFVILFTTLALTGSVVAGPRHLDLEMSSEEYRVLLQTIKTPSYKSTKADDPAITRALKMGERLSQWISIVNSLRTPETAIRLTSPGTRRGIPIDKPNKYSPSIIGVDTEEILKTLPSEMKDVLLATTELPSTLPLDDDNFILLARKVDRNYQSAARYKAVDRDRMYYIGAASKDVRGYHYLLSKKIGENELREVSAIPAEQVKPIKEALALICLNSTGELKKCEAQVQNAFTKNALQKFYKTYIKGAKKTWDEFFKIPVSGRRTDIKWKKDSATIPFNNPSIPKFIPYLKDNIEDEFRFGPWALKLIFGQFANGPYVKFEPGVVPHVNRLGGNEIVMDSNQAIEEYESQWTIRHEFGHIVGLPDCYHEFYDVTAKSYVNYQLDITDLMCSRAGNMNERIYLELKKAYKK